MWEWKVEIIETPIFTEKIIATLVMANIVYCRENWSVILKRGSLSQDVMG
jgi:hypothetical protein